LGGEEIDQLPGLVVHRRNEQGIPEGRAVLAVIEDFHRDIAPLGDRRLDLPDHMPVGVRPLEKAAVVPVDVLGGVAGHFEKGVIGEDDRVVGLIGVGHGHRHARRGHGGEKDVSARR
jgi:hypothetical protein